LYKLPVDILHFLQREPVRARHQQIKIIERDIGEVAGLFGKMYQFVIEQEHAVGLIEQKGEEVEQSRRSATVELQGAVSSGRSRQSTRRWRFLISSMYTNFLSRIS
jgi:t-SNARE complex subunit (syntaxin)